MKSVDATKFSNDVNGEKKFTDDFIGFLKTKGIKVYEFEDKDHHFIVDPKYDDSGKYIEGTGEFVGYYFIPNNKLKIEGHGEKEKQVANAIKEYVEKPAAAPRLSHVNRFREMVSTASNAMRAEEGGRKTRAKKEPKRKTRKAKKSTRRR